MVHGQLELHRRNPLYHLGELDLACYDRDYAPARAAGAGPQPAPGRVAADGRALLSSRSTWSARRWPPRCWARSAVSTAAIPADADERSAAAARAAHARLMAHLEQAAADWRSRPGARHAPPSPRS